jgi:hypothetical protein
MKKCWLIGLVALLATMATGVTALGAEGSEAAAQAAELKPAQMQPEKKESKVAVDFVINAIPAALLINMQDNNFAVNDSLAGRRTASSSVYLMPNIAAGPGMELATDFYVDLTVGGGLLVNDSLRSFFVQGILSAAYRASDSLDIGPHVGLLYFTNPEWLDSDNVEFESNIGYLLGLQISMGDKIKYLVSVDFIGSSFDVSTKAAEVAVEGGDKSLDLSGLAVQFGVRGEF